MNATQQCPICGAVQPPSARKCSICGAVLAGELAPVVATPAADEKPKRSLRPRFDPAAGDDDLYVSDLSGRMWRLIFFAAVGLALLSGLGLGIIITRGDGEKTPRVELIGPPTAPPTATPRGGDFTPAPGELFVTPIPGEFVTETPRPLITLATVTPMPPTPTETPTPGPCYQTAQQGDTVYGMAIRCGHLDMAVVDLILQINHMDSATQLQLGQTLEIPWPTPTPGAEPTEAPPASSDSGDGNGQSAILPTQEVAVNEFGTPDALVKYENVEPTLRPGQAWHTIQPGDTIMGIAYAYDTTVELLSQINPEIPFLQCDYGQRYGGPNCAVMLYEGQRLRVPVAIPTITPTPTPAVRTATPTPTPTFNAPYPITPDDGVHFNADQMITLRWGGTGTLATNERYVVHVRDLDAGQEYVAVVSDTTYILPGGWQPDDRNRHEFEWEIAVGVVDAQFNVVSEDHLTEPRRFTWDSR
jgi:LysM repeat protein